MTTEKNTIIKWKFQKGITEEEKDAAIKAGLAKISNYAGVKHSCFGDRNEDRRYL